MKKSEQYFEESQVSNLIEILLADLYISVNQAETLNKYIIELIKKVKTETILQSFEIITKNSIIEFRDSVTGEIFDYADILADEEADVVINYNAAFAKLKNHFETNVITDEDIINS